jgi:hypothetical protein
LFAIGFLDIDKRMLPVEVRGDEVSSRRDAERLGEILGVFEVDEGFAVLLNRECLYGSQPGSIKHE